MMGTPSKQESIKAVAMTPSESGPLQFTQKDEPVAGAAAPELSSSTSTSSLTRTLPWAAPTTPQSPWGTTADSASKREWKNSNASSSFASIMAEQTRLAEHDRERESQQEQEEREMLLAIQASLLEQEQMESSQSSEPDGKSDQAGDVSDAEVRGAIALSFKEESSEHDTTIDHTTKMRGSDEGAVSTTPSTNTNIDQNYGIISPEEAQEIERAVREADEAEAAMSFQLAIQLQNEETSMYTDTVQSSKQQGNVRLVTKDAFLQQQSSATIPCHVSDNDYVDDEDFEDKHGNAGFRINSPMPSQSWSRIDRSSIIGPDNELRTKHDLTLQGQANAHRLGLMDETGHVGNRAYNSFRQSMQRKTHKGVAAHGHGRATADTDRTRGGAMDPKVRLVISKAINNGIINVCNGVVKEGKEALVYHATEGIESSSGYDVAVKVFKRIQEFKQRGLYVDGDPRYYGKQFGAAGAREQLEVWAEKEHRNLVRANRAGVPVPTPLFQKENVLFMRFLGDDCWPSPQLKELELKRGSKKWNVFYTQTMASIQR
jgi:serine/threonine-protein kinase RIO1